MGSLVVNDRLHDLFARFARVDARPVGACAHCSEIGGTH